MMAAQERSERHLMRQRGAGARNATNVDFGLEFGTGGGREQRQLMRQRGAGNRKIQNIDFGISFPTPNESRRSRSKTPHTSVPGQSRTTKTPNRASREPSIPGSKRRTSVRQSGTSSTQRQTVRALRISQSPIPTTSKRKNLAEVDNGTAHAKPTPRALKALRQASGPSQGAVPVSVQPISVPYSTDANVHSPEIEFDAQAGPVSGYEGDKENHRQHAEISKAQSKWRTPQSNAKNDLRQKKRTTNVSEIEPVLPSIKIGAEESYQGSMADADQDSEEDAEFEIEANVPMKGKQLEIKQNKGTQRDVPAQAPKKRKKRKSVILGRKKRRSSGNTTLGTRDEQSSKQGGSSVQQPIPSEDGENETEQGITSEKTAGSGTASWNERVKRPTELPRLNSEERLLRETDRDEEEDETYMPDEPTPEPTPAPKRKRTINNRTAGTSTNDQPTAKRRKSTFPIETYRLANAEALPTITEEADSDDNDQESYERIPSTFSTRAAANGVDVLAQICRETIATAIENLESAQGSNTGRAELKRKRTALEAFGSALNDRLFDMSQAVEQRLTLESRLRKTKREKGELQARWIQVRRQREQIALKSDAVRRQHWEEEEQAKRRWEISEAAMTVEMEIERGGGGDQQDSLEFLLKSLSADVSRKSDNGGILDRVKAFNAQLERLALALERR